MTTNTNTIESTSSNIAVEVLNNPSKEDGQGVHRAGSVLEKALEAAKSEELNITIDDAKNVYVNGQNLNIGAAVTAAFLPAFDNKVDVSIDKLLKYFNSGVVSLAQYKLVGKTVETSKSIAQTVKRLLTAEEYLENALKLTEIDNFELYTQLTHFTDKSTKAELLTFVTNLKQTLLKDEQFNTYKALLEKEEKLNSLKDLGFFQFNRFEGVDNKDTFTAIISAEQWREAKPELEESFKFIAAVSTKTDDAGYPLQFKVTFVNKEVE